MLRKYHVNIKLEMRKQHKLIMVYLRVNIKTFFQKFVALICFLVFEFYGYLFILISKK